MINLKLGTKYGIDYTAGFKKQLKKVQKQGKDMTKLTDIITKLANGEELDKKYKNHILNDSKHYKGCGECHIESDWLLVYQYINGQLVLLLVATGSHSLWEASHKLCYEK